MVSASCCEVSFKLPLNKKRNSLNDYNTTDINVKHNID